MSFYRTYRPQVIDEIDNVAVREAMLRLLTKKKSELPHAFLFSGPRGSGKTTSARLIAKLFNCLSPTKSGPCGKCEQCVSIAEGKNLDVLEIDAASNRGIDEIRTLRDGINLAPVGSNYKIYIIDEVHMLTTEAFNALLKTLEEPPAHAVFVLATTDPQKVPVTIKSRCIAIAFTKATTEELRNALARIVEKEKIPIDSESLNLIATSVDGAFRDAVKYLEQVSFHKGKITVTSVRSILSMSDQKTRETFLLHLSKKHTKEAIEIVGTLVHDGGDIKTFIADCVADLETILIASVQGSPSDMWSQDELREAIRRLSQAYVELKGTPITQLPLELAVVEFCNEKQQAVASSEPQSAPRTQAGKHSVVEEKTDSRVKPEEDKKEENNTNSSGLLTIEKLTEHWTDVINELKPYNHSVAGVMRSTRPKALVNGIVTIEAFYSFHKEKLSETKTREIIANVLKKLFGEKVKVDVVLGKK